MMRLFILVIFTFSLTGLKAQKLNCSVSQSNIYIGQPIALTLSVQLSEFDSIIFLPQKDALTALIAAESGSLTSSKIEFEISEEFVDTFLIDKGKKTWIGQYVITAWDSGVFILPGQKISINDSTYVFEDIAVNCQLTDKIDGIDLYDIKENFAAVPDKPFSLLDFLRKNWWWLFLIIATVIGLLYFKIRGKNKPTEVIRSISLKERTIIAIEALENAKLWEKEQLKTHFVELSFILRSYLTSRYNISLLEKTTNETKILLTQKGLNDDTIDVIIRMLSQSDMVKFAKSTPDVIAILRVSTLAKQIVAETSPLEFDNAE